MSKPTKRKESQSSKKIGKGGLKARTAPTSKDEDDDQDDWEGDTEKGATHPDDQLTLTNEELDEDIARMLQTLNPQTPENVVNFSFKELEFVPITIIPQAVVMYDHWGSLIYGHPADEEEEVKEAEGGVPSMLSGAEIDDEDDVKEDDERRKTEATSLVPIVPEDDSKIRNRFNFCDRASLTANNPYRDRGAQTEPPPRLTFSSNVTQWEIFDTYQEDFALQEKNKEKKEKDKKKEEEKEKKKLPPPESSGEDLGSVIHVAKILERMINQNNYDEIALDFKFWEDPADEYRENKGTLLPLWKFSYNPTRNMTVTCLCWNPRYADLFAAGYGTYDFLHQGKGKICLFSLKSPSYPEWIYQTESGVFSIDFHRQNPHLLAAGMCDGCVAVFNLKDKKQGPTFYSSDPNTKHYDPVWKVSWLDDDLDGNMNFSSISGDGRVINWMLVKTELKPTEMLLLKREDCKLEGPEGILMETISSGTVLAIQHNDSSLFLVGTEEGLIHKCSTVYTSQYLMTYRGHHLSVYNIEWNPYHPRVFISCSADWLVHIWDHQSPEPVFTFDLKNKVEDVSWAPYASTVFAAVTADGKAHVFDLHFDKHQPICQQAVMLKKKTKPTHIAFNPTHPLLLVGDDRGQIISLKLSPNLRKNLKEMTKIDPTKLGEVEILKMEKLLQLAKESSKKDKETAD